MFFYKKKIWIVNEICINRWMEKINFIYFFFKFCRGKNIYKFDIEFI